MNTDIVVGLQLGDEGKGKITHALLKDPSYTHCLRFSGGGNAGHTIYHNGVKYVTHYIPAGVFYGKKSIIGPGCVVNVAKFFEEYNTLKDAGIAVEGNVFIANNTNIVTQGHINEESNETAIGTTRTGNGPAYRDKYARTGIRAEDIPLLEPFLIDMYTEFHIRNPKANILCEGAQGFYLDIDWGNYPYVTSSHCTVAGVFLNGIPVSSKRTVYGVAKVYETYVGNKEDYQDSGDPIFDEIRELGKEYGATTGRPRKCNWLDLQNLRKSVNMNEVDELLFNKIDILRQLNRWEIRNPNITFTNEQEFTDYLRSEFPQQNVVFSDSPERI